MTPTRRADGLHRLLGIEVARLGDELVRVRRHLHAHPELAFQETETAALVGRRCAALGFRVRTRVGGTGVLADLDVGPGPCVLVRADMDALPLQDGKDDRPYRSTVDGVAHACGHDGHVAIALAVAEIMARLRHAWSGRLRLCFQPAEEVDQGATRMIEDGALESVDHALGLHLESGIPTGTVAIGEGVQWAGSDELRLSIEGGGGHAADPSATTDPVAIAAEVILALKALSADPPAPGVVTIARIRAGAAPNVIPEAAALAGTLRHFSSADRERLLAEVEGVARRIVEGNGASLRFSLGVSCPPVVCDPHVTGVVRAALEASPAPMRTVDGRRGTGSDDMARFLAGAPGCYFRVGAGDSSAGPPAPHHHPMFDLDERALPVGTEALARAALALLGRP